ncbi:hypothetical protein [Flammeovirga sp. EKP202]|uniref:hypothetical protein n=1 Tax=Flammeovirga sp. EKP202 TaxID=2770592 RepID=UPI00165FEEFF|nr:hypothetical protein [Flammeovirga sp. EKP202]MBD0402996.1 hypothetical protein [Flammeovirga sp. EKP202]
MQKLNLIVLIGISISIIWFNIKLHTQHFSKEETKEDILLQLNFLENELKYKHLGEDMQELFP